MLMHTHTYAHAYPRLHQHTYTSAGASGADMSMGHLHNVPGGFQGGAGFPGMNAAYGQQQV